VRRLVLPPPVGRRREFRRRGAGRIDTVEPVASIIERCAADCLAVIARLAKTYPA